VDKYCSTHF